MGLFDKKNCDVCGEKIGLLGNKKLEDGNLCKDCAKKLSPFFSDRKNSTVEEIKKQLLYRQENEAQLKYINPDKTFGVGRKVYVDTANKKFVVTASNDWRSANPDIIDFSQVLGCDTEIEETKKEIYEQDNEGKQKSYDPPRYEYSYKFKVNIRVNSPWFDDIEVDLSFGQDPESRFTEEYRQFEQQMYELKAVITGTEVNYTPTAGTAGSGIMDALGTLGGIIANGIMNNGVINNTANTAPAQGTWQCSCGTVNNGNFCGNCGSKKPVSNTLSFRCSRCGWAPQEGAAPPKFCPQCGDPFDMSDIAN